MTPAALAVRLADWLAQSPGIVRVAIDGAPSTAPVEWAERLRDPLAVLGRSLIVVRTRDFWKDASVRLEHGREDVESYLNWLDHGALRREVLTGRTYLPSLRDPVTNRATRTPAEPVPDDAVLAVCGSFLLGLGLPFDRVVHLSMSAAALARHTPSDEAWTLPAFEQYDSEVAPDELADVVVRLEHLDRPAVRGLDG